MKNILSIILFLIVGFCYSQNITIRGTILDESNLSPMSYVNIHIQNYGIGTISGKKGEFVLKIPERYKTSKIVFSFIGYKTIEKTIEEISFKPTIHLKQSDVRLNEVIIMPDSTLLTLLEKAYNKIPENYPMYPTKLKGFYREVLRTPENQYLYFAEAVIEMYKSSYKIKSDDGQVKILKSLVNQFPGADTINNVKFYGGIFSANNGDFVKKRTDFINPKHFNRYNYSLTGTTYYFNKPVYIIEFDTNNDSLNGSRKGMFYIDKESLAYVGAKYVKTKRGIKHYNIRSTREYTQHTYSFNVSYIFYQGKWHLKYIIGNQEGVSEKYSTKIVFEREFITTKIQTEIVLPIPFMERIEYGDIFSDKAKEYYSDNYWSEYNVLQQDSILKDQIKPLYTTEESKELLTMKITTPDEKLMFKILKKISFQYGISYLPFQSKSGLYTINYNTAYAVLNASEEFKPLNYFSGYYLQYNYSIHKRLDINYKLTNSLNKQIYYESHNIGFTYRILVNRKTSPLILGISMMYSNQSIGRNFDIINSSTEFSYNNKQIDAEKLQFSIGNNIHGLRTGIRLDYRLIRRIWIYSSASYYFPIKQTDKLYLQEKSGFFLTRKNTSINLDNNKVNFTYNGTSIDKSQIDFKNYTIDVGLMLKF